MTSNKLRLFAAAVAAVFMFADIAAAMPVAPIANWGEMSPTMTRGGRGGGRAVAHRGGGGYRGGGRAVAHRGGRGAVAVRGPQGGRAVAVRGGAYRGRPVPGRGAVVVGGRGAWGRGYTWAPGGAIAAGAAIGFVAAASAAAYASSRPPAAGLCWYYTDASRRSGFWDTCP
jgi:hypothetical protein